MTTFLRLKLSRGNIIAANIIQAMVNLKTVLLINFRPITIVYECEAILLLCDSVNYNNIFLEKKKQKIDAHKQPPNVNFVSHVRFKMIQRQMGRI